jgi:hypothetical protein
MRCIMCGAEMILMKVVKDETMMVSGFEHHTYMCSVCNDIEQRFVFNKHVENPPRRLRSLFKAPQPLRVS